MIDDGRQTEEFVKENDYTLSIVRKSSGSEDSFKFRSRMTRSFNFLAAQVTTTTRDILLLPNGYQAGGGPAISTTTTMQRFDEFQSDAELLLMREKLVAMGGHPPAPDDTLNKPALRKPAA